MHKLASSFVLGYHGCDEKVAESLLSGNDFQPSTNDYDWLGPGVYFWEANPIRGLEFAEEIMRLDRGPNIKIPAVVGAVVDLGLCLDLTTSAGIQQIGDSYKELARIASTAERVLPKNSKNLLLRKLDCEVVKFLHGVRKANSLPQIDTLRGVFVEGDPLFDGSGFYEKTHIQICVCNPECVKGVFRVPKHQLS